MGFFSKTCAKTHLPIVADMKDIPRLSQVVALLPNGKKFTGAYDGYGRVAGTGLVETARGRFQWPEVKMVLAEYYNGEEYKDLGRSGDELAQGYFMDPLFLNHCLRNGPFESYAEYKKAFKKYANW